MNTAIVYYSFGGATRRYAEALAAKRDADIYEVKEAKKRGMISAFFNGCPAAMHQKGSALAGKFPDLSPYETILLACPVWAGFPAPAFNTVANQLPSGKKIEIYLTSGSGNAEKCHEAVKALVEKSGSTVVSLSDVKTDKK